LWAEGGGEGEGESMCETTNRSACEDEKEQQNEKLDLKKKV
jgi:hypothetical protein